MSFKKFFSICPFHFDAAAQAQSSFYLTYSFKKICVQLNISIALLCMPIQMSDTLFYTARVDHMFRVHGQIPLNDLFVEERTDNPTQYSFSIYSNNRYEEIIAKISIADYVSFCIYKYIHKNVYYIIMQLYNEPTHCM